MLCDIKSFKLENSVQFYSFVSTYIHSVSMLQLADQNVYRTIPRNGKHLLESFWEIFEIFGIITINVFNVNMIITNFHRSWHVETEFSAYVHMLINLQWFVVGHL